MKLPVDPLEFKRVLWPDVTFYDKQVEVIYSVRDNNETFVPAGHQLGKDFVSGFIALWFFLTRHPCRVITTSADYSQLESVLWGEIRRFIQTSAYPLEQERGGPLLINHLHIRKVLNPGAPTAQQQQPCGLSYLIGRVAAKGEGLQGHHIAKTGDGIPRTLLLMDEASGIEDLAYERSQTWANRILVIGNPYSNPRGANFFEKAVKGGDIVAS